MTEEVDKVKGLAYDNKARLDTHEALCALRYQQILEKLEQQNDQITHLTSKVESLTTLATKGTTTLANYIWLGSATVAVSTFIIMVLKTFKII